jgi:hypothetical protein
MCMRHIVVSVTCSAVQYFSSFSQTERFKKKLEKHKSFDFLYEFVWNIFYSKNKWERYDQKRVLFIMHTALYYCQVLIKLLFSLQSMEISSYNKFHENSSNGRRPVPCGRTDMLQLIVAYRNFTKPPKNCMIVKNFEFILKTSASTFALIIGALILQLRRIILNTFQILVE